MFLWYSEHPKGSNDCMFLKVSCLSINIQNAVKSLSSYKISGFINKIKIISFMSTLFKVLSEYIE